MTAVDPSGVLLAPVAEGQQDRLQCPALLAQAVFDPGRNDRIDLADDQAVALQLPQLFGQHALGDVPDIALQLVVPLGAVEQMVERDALPLAADPLERRIHRAPA